VIKQDIGVNVGDYIDMRPRYHDYLRRGRDGISRRRSNSDLYRRSALLRLYEKEKESEKDQEQ
jgi:hypothetical protein